MWVRHWLHCWRLLVEGTLQRPQLHYCAVQTLRAACRASRCVVSRGPSLLTALSGQPAASVDSSDAPTAVSGQRWPRRCLPGAAHPSGALTAAARLPAGSRASCC